MNPINPHGFSKHERKILDAAREETPEIFERIMAQFENGEVSRADALWLLGDNQCEHVELADMMRPWGRSRSYRGRAGHQELVAIAARAQTTKAGAAR